MKYGSAGYRVAVVGASSLLGKELLAAIEQRGFPVAVLSTFDGEAAEPDLPILDLAPAGRVAAGAESVDFSEFDFVFVTGAKELWPPFLQVLEQNPSALSPSDCAVIDLQGGLSRFKGAARRIPRSPTGL